MCPTHLKGDAIEMKRIASLLLLVALMMSLLVTEAFATTYPTDGETRVKTTLRKDPKPKGKKVADLKAGYELVEGVLEPVSGEDGQVWYKIITPKEKEGYIIGTDLAVVDNDRDEDARNAVVHDILLLDFKATCTDYQGLGKKYTQGFEVNGKPLTGRHPQTEIGADCEFTIYTKLTNTGKSKATGEARSLFTPTMEDIYNGFAVQQKVTCVAGDKEVEWTVTYTFLPRGIEKAPVTYEVDNVESFETGVSAANNTVIAGSNAQTEAQKALEKIHWDCPNGHKENLGTWLFCPFCGAPKPETAQ